MAKVSLLDELKAGGYEACLITTFSAYFPFYEEVVLRRLVSSGVTHNAVMMDAGMCAEAVQSAPPALAGRFYSLLPVSISSAFHPKLIMLVGKKKGLLLIGSHNLTIAGFGFNREVTNVVRVEGDGDLAGIGAFDAALASVEHWLQLAEESVPAHALNMLRRMADFAPWLKNAKGPIEGESEIHVLGSSPGRGPLLNAVARWLPENVRRIWVIGAFFDRENHFLYELAATYQPDEMLVGIDPETVEANPSVSASSPWRWVNVGRIANPNETERPGYMHAKLLCVEAQDGQMVVVAGSANPSAPAWLNSASDANAEMVVVHTGDAAKQAFSDLSIADLNDASDITVDDWNAIAGRKRIDESMSVTSVRTGLVAVENGKLVVSSCLLRGLESCSLQLVLTSGEVIGLGRIPSELSTHYCVDGDAAQLDQSDFVEAVNDPGIVVARFLVHHCEGLGNKARTGVQRRLSDALSSLSSDSPDFEVLIGCVEQILFDDQMSHASRAAPRVTSVSPGHDVTIPSGHSIEVSELDKRAQKARMNHGNDLTFLLDALIFNLRSFDAPVMEATDDLGRSEEEQVGADDEERVLAPTAAVMKDAVCQACRQKLGVLIRRMSEQLTKYRAVGADRRKVLVRLLGVLAVLRHLSNEAPKLSWVPAGVTLIPEKELAKLFEAIMYGLFAGEHALARISDWDQDFHQSEDLSRLKDLLIWLTWEVRIRMQLNRPFNESQVAKEQRLQRNAFVLGMASAFAESPDDITEAIRLFNRQDSEVIAWMERMRQIAGLSQGGVPGEVNRCIPGTAEPGDVVFLGKDGDKGMRLLLTSDSKKAFVLTLDAKKPVQEYERDFVVIVPARDIFGEGVLDFV